MQFEAFNGRRSFRATDPNEAGALAFDGNPRRRRDVLVCAVKQTEAGNEYQVPVGYFSREMYRRWRKEE